MSKADEELENLFSGLTLKTPTTRRTNTAVAPLTNTAADSDNDEDIFEECISFLSTTSERKGTSAALCEKEDDDSEIIFNTKYPNDTDDIFAEELLGVEFMENILVDSSEGSHRATRDPLQGAQLGEPQIPKRSMLEANDDPFTDKNVNHVLPEALKGLPNVPVPLTTDFNFIQQSLNNDADPIPGMLTQEAALLSLQADEPRAEPQIAMTDFIAAAEEQLTSDNAKSQEDCQELGNPPSTVDALTTEPSSPPILTKGTYNFSFAEESDPFGNGSNIGNSSTTSKPSMTEADPGSAVIVDSSVTKPSKVKPIKTKLDLSNSHMAKPVEDPFKTKSAVANSPEGIFKAKSAVANSTLDKFVDEDPFRTRSAVQNSPEARPAEDDCLKTKAVITISPLAKLIEENPCETKSAIANSPVDRFAVENTFQTKSAVQNSPLDRFAVENPFQTKSAVANSPVDRFAVENPFQTKSAVANSPVDRFAVENTFQTKSAVQNSPVDRFAVENPFQTKSAVQNSPVDRFAVENPFQTKSAVQNSPVARPIAEDPLMTKAAVANSPVEDPFQTKSAIANSPVAKPTEEDTFNTKSAVANSPVNKFTEENTFKTKSIVTNSPVVRPSEEDPFKASTTMMNSPPKIINKVELDPFNTLPTESDLKEDPIDPFKARTILANSPPPMIEGSDVHSLNPNKVMANSSTGVKEAVTAIPTATPTRDETKKSEQMTKQSLQILDSDTKNPAEEFVATSDFLNDSATWEMLNKFGSEDDMKPSSLARQSLYVQFDPLIRGVGKLPTQPSAMNETATWDLLNQYGHNQGKSTSRESLYTLFDPLVKKDSPGVHYLVSRLKPHAEVPEKSDDPLIVSTPLCQSKGEDEPAPKLFCFSPPTVRAQAPISENSPLIPGLSEMDMLGVLKYSQSDMSRMRKELELQFEAQLLSQSKELELKYEAELLSRDRAMAAEKEELTAEIQRVKKQEEQERQNHEQMGLIITEYELSLEQMIQKMTMAKAKEDEMKVERDQALEDIKGVETFCSNLHSRYEKLKTSVIGFKQNEEQLKKYAAEMEARSKKCEQKYVLIKQKAEEKIATLVAEYQKCEDDAKKKIARLDATNRKYVIQNKSLQQQVEQKTSENAELMKICDELLGPKEKA